MRPAAEAQPAFVAAFTELTSRIAASLANVAPQARPIRMVVAGGAAMHLYTGVRVSRDVDAAFSHRIALPQNLWVPYRDADGQARSLYFDYQYTDSMALMHESANDDAVPLSLPGIDAELLDVRLLTPVDLAVSKLSRFAEVDRGDIVELARKGLVQAAALRQRATEALAGHVGDLVRVRRSIEMACNLILNISHRTPPPG